MKKISILTMFFVTLASFDAQAQAPTGKIGCNMQDAKNPAAKIPTVTENLDWILHGTAIDGIAYYNNRLQPGAAEYSANASVARTASLQAFCNELTAINFATNGELHAVDGKPVVITQERVLGNEAWLKAHTESMKIDFGTKPMIMAAANLKTRSLDTVIHANGLGVQSVTVLKLKQGMFPLFLDLCGNEGGPDFALALVNGTAKIVEAPAPAPNAGLQGTPNPTGTPNPAATPGITKEQLDLINAQLAMVKSNAKEGSIIFAPIYIGGNSSVSGGGQNGRDGKDGKDGTASSSPTITTTTTPPQVDPFAPGTPGRSLVVSNNNAPQGWVTPPSQVMTQQTACPTCTGVSQSSWNRSDVALIEQQGQTNIAQNDQMIRQNGQMIKLQKTSNGIQGAQLGVQIVGTGFQIADDFGAFNNYKVRPVVNVINRFFTGGNTPSNGGPSDFPNGINGTVSSNGGGPSDFRNGW